MMDVLVCVFCVRGIKFYSHFNYILRLNKEKEEARYHS
jgi:hypothetical protein